MPGDISYTPREVAELLKISRYTVYELIKRGELKAYRVGRKVRVEASDLEAFKWRARDDFSGVQPAPGVAPPTGGGPAAAGAPSPLAPSREPVIICGQDAVLDILERHLERVLPGCSCLRNHSGSSNGLFALYHRRANVATCHLWDGDTDEYNIPYIRRILPGQPVVVYNLVYRTAGFYVAGGNPLGITGWTDLVKPGIRFVNREPGSGCRVLLDEKLRRLGLDRHLVRGYERVEMTHLAVASCVARGEADVGLGAEAVAGQVKGIDFIPLQKERYDLVIRREDLNKPFARAILSILHSPDFRREVEGMGTYDISRMGDLIAEL
ncbi:molybdopterin biosynthesis protein [Thermacetogenium phaeum DSM 12270]|uniref:Molybdopterin biosynthesis protein n=1 Tax=Thermacetogenium phaeum (strain ATCC BAA-254 / DSM 26808 / PB) TaxID=1089553 RepID=K4LL85_THEPS|nr:helix-turn-helix transcriptional regulator [Thermacetogenium phaeum]AFV12807.1 molybdopterin biosynthesis protein [Thermacetogenium phaeum DSM 12270]MDK2881015.1 putative molybdopterin biosynthesis protein [Clostridia bacterium]